MIFGDAEIVSGSLSRGLGSSSGHSSGQVVYCLWYDVPVPGVLHPDNRRELSASVLTNYREKSQKKSPAHGNTQGGRAVCSLPPKMTLYGANSGIVQMRRPIRMAVSERRDIPLILVDVHMQFYDDLLPGHPQLPLPLPENPSLSVFHLRSPL